MGFAFWIRKLLTHSGKTSNCSHPAHMCPLDSCFPLWQESFLRVHRMLPVLLSCKASMKDRSNCLLPATPETERQKENNEAWQMLLKELFLVTGKWVLSLFNWLFWNNLKYWYLRHFQTKISKPCNSLLLQPSEEPRETENRNPDRGLWRREKTSLWWSLSCDSRSPVTWPKHN